MLEDGRVRRIGDTQEREVDVRVVAATHCDLEACPAMSLRDFKAQCEKEYVESVLRRTRWNVAAAARLLEIQRTYLHQKITVLGIRRPRGEAELAETV